jgi:peptidoglycan/LPS O-acetylase OafA/YrhL
MERKSELDGIRGLAIFFVLIWHYVNRQIDPNANSILAYLKLASNVTWSGVDLFFVLSGFLIGGILLDHRACSNYFRVFYIRRACRIFPLYFAVVFLFIAVSQNPSPSYAWLFADALPTWSYLTFTQNYAAHGFDKGAHWLGITWSLAVEEQFYLGLPLLIRFAPPPLLVFILLTLIVLAPIMRFWVGGVGSFEYTFCRADSLLMGVLLAWLYRKPLFTEFLKHHQATCWSILSTMILLTSFTPLIAYELGGVGNHFWFAILYGVFLILIVVFRESRLAGVMRQRWLVWLGVRSYFIYLIHQAVSGLLHAAIFATEPRIGSPFQFLVTVMSLTAALLLASASYRYFESPVLSYGHKFSYRDAPLNDNRQVC